MQCGEQENQAPASIRAKVIVNKLFETILTLEFVFGLHVVPFSLLRSLRRISTAGLEIEHLLVSKQRQFFVSSFLKHF